jgi:hypothetical protein
VNSPNAAAPSVHHLRFSEARIRVRIYQSAIVSAY